MSVSLSPVFNGFQGFSTAGLPLARGLLNTYLAGTATPAGTYTDNTGLVLNANPIQLDAAGLPPNEIWLTQGVAYKFVLTDSLGLNPRTFDNITGIDSSALAALLAASGGSALIGFIGTTGTIATTLQARGRLVVWSFDYGHLPSAVAATNDAALLAAMTAVYNAGGGTINIAAGTYQHITVPFAWAAAITVNLVGAGENATFLQKSGVTTSKVLAFSQSVGVLDTYSTFAEFSILGNAKGSGGMSATLMARCKTRNFKISGCDVGLDMIGSLIWDHYNLDVNSNNIGFRTAKSGSVFANLHNFYGGAARSNSTHGFDIAEASGVHWYGSDIEQNGTTLNTSTGNVVIRSSVSSEIGVANISMNGGWCEASLGSNFVVEAASGLMLTVKDTILASAEAHLSMTVGAIQSLNLLNVQAASGGDTITTAAVNCTVIGGNINVLADSATSFVHLGVTNNGAPLNEIGGTGGKLSLKNGSVNSGSGAVAGVVTATPTTLFALPGATPGLYLVFAYIVGAGTIYMANARYCSEGTNAARVAGENGANLSLTLSGSNVQVTQVSGVNQTVSYVYERIA